MNGYDTLLHKTPGKYTVIKVIYTFLHRTTAIKTTIAAALAAAATTTITATTKINVKV